VAPNDVDTEDWGATPPRLKPFEPLLRSLPPAVSARLLEVFGMADGAFRKGRWHRARRFARAHRPTHGGAVRLALSLLAHHGRFIHLEMCPGLAMDTTIVGEGHLACASAGALLLSFHLGPPHSGRALRMRGYPVSSATRLEYLDEARVRKLDDEGASIKLSGDDPRARALALMRLRRLLAGGGLVRINADGSLGRGVCAIPVTGGEIVLRQGWLTLRRQTRVPVLPLLARMEGRRRVIELHPPLPPVDPDPARDLGQCLAVLTPLLAAYVRQHPEQCRYVVYPRGPQIVDAPWLPLYSGHHTTGGQPSSLD